MEAIGQADSFLEFQEKLSRAARVDRPVLLIGERGTGKELAAAKLHYLSQRWEGPFVTLNCAALVSTLIEAELFGHEAGAFTGAARRRSGRFEAAHGGTLFLDEIGQIPMEVQEKILRAVEYKMFETVGSSSAMLVDTRIVGATNADLPALADSGRFKRDLLDRLSFEVLFVPPLRARPGDIMLLAGHFAARMAHELGWTELPVFSDPAVAQLQAYSWPGNVRELKNVVERAVYRSSTTVVDEIAFDPFVSPFTLCSPPERALQQSPAEREIIGSGSGSFNEKVRQLEVKLLREGLAKAKYNQRAAARLLGLTYHQFRGLLKKYRDELERDL